MITLSGFHCSNIIENTLIGICLLQEWTIVTTIFVKLGYEIGSSNWESKHSRLTIIYARMKTEADDWIGLLLLLLLLLCSTFNLISFILHFFENKGHVLWCTSGDPLLKVIVEIFFGENPSFYKFFYLSQKLY